MSFNLNSLQMTSNCVITNARHDSLEPEGTTDEASNNVGLVAISQAKQEVGLFGIHLAQDVGPTAIALQEATVHLFRQFVNFGLVGLDDNDFVALLDECLSGFNADFASSNKDSSHVPSILLPNQVPG